MSPHFTKGRRKHQQSVHDTLFLQCLGMRWEENKECQTLIGLAMDIGPAVFRCPVCDALWCVDPPSKDNMDDGIIVIEDWDGHRIEVFDQRRSRPLLRAWESGEDEGVTFLMRKQGQCRKIYVAAAE